MIGADQILVCDGVWFDKPLDVAAAREQLRALRGRSHELVTAVVCHQGGRRVWHDVASRVSRCGTSAMSSSRDIWRPKAVP